MTKALAVAAVLLAAVAVASASPALRHGVTGAMMRARHHHDRDHAPAKGLPAPPASLPPWPEAFSVSFNLTILEFGFIGASSKLYYDWTIPAQRIDFGLCAANGVLSPCSVVFNATGAYILQAGKCCLTAPVGPPHPQWVSGLTYNTTTVAYSQAVWLYRGGTPIHDYYASAETGSPVFLQVEDITECWSFLETLQVGPQDPALFTLPDNCSASC